MTSAYEDEYFVIKDIKTGDYMKKLYQKARYLGLGRALRDDFDTTRQHLQSKVREIQFYLRR